MNMGSSASKYVAEKEVKYNGIANAITMHTTIRSSSCPVKDKSPMPDAPELERRFTKILASMDLPPDKAKLLRQYDDMKKWDMICDQEKVSAKESPNHYLNKLRTYLDPKASRSSRKRRMVGDATSTQVLRDLEISLRTNSIEWVREFLSEDNEGLDVIINYLYFRLMMLRHEQRLRRDQEEDEDKANGSARFGTMTEPINSPNMKRASRHVHRLNMGDTKDDIHVCIMCLRAIMNNKYGFNLIFEHREAINCITLSLNHHSLRTKALVLELLAAICLVKGGHEIILSAFDNFKDVCNEKSKFHTLMNYFIHYECFHIEFMVACMQFINIVVHSVEDMNFRVYLQYEFSQLGLDSYLEKLRLHESEELQVQISAYLDNVFDVSALMEDSETKTAAVERVAELEDELAHTMERSSEVETEMMSKMVEVESELVDVRRQKQELEQAHTQVQEEVSTLRRAASEKEEASREKQTKLEQQIQQLESLRSSSSRESISDSSLSSPPVPPPPPPQAIATPPPAPPPPRMTMGIAPPPPPPGMAGSPIDAMTIKRKVTTKYKLPTLNWVALKPNQVRGTVFNELDDEKLYSVIDFCEFEEHFKIGNAGYGRVNGDATDSDSFQAFGSKRFKRPELTSLMEHTRLRNIAISRRKLECSVEVVTRAVNSLDLVTLELDNVELLQRMVPNDAEIKAYKEYEKERRPLHQLTEEDQYMFHLCKIDRLAIKLQIMSFVANFFDNIQIVSPQIHAIITASRAVKSSSKLRRFLEIILAFGNYMNSGRRGPAYGFKLSSLDNLCDTKSADKKMSLLHYIQDTIRCKFPDMSNFENDLHFTEKAAQVSLENILTDITEFEKGMDQVRKEYSHARDLRSGEGQAATTVLRDFLMKSEDKLKKVKCDVKTSQDAFNEVLEYFGESRRSMPPNTFFAIFARFVKAYKTVLAENEQRRRLEAAARQAALKQQLQQQQAPKFNPRKQQEAIVSEMKARGVVADKRLLPQEDVYHGALEDILSSLKNEPYRRADAVRRSLRKRNENVRLSRTFDEMDL